MQTVEGEEWSNRHSCRLLRVRSVVPNMTYILWRVMSGEPYITADCVVCEVVDKSRPSNCTGFGVAD